MHIAIKNGTNPKFSEDIRVMRNNWQPTASKDILQKRSEIIVSIREFFHSRNYLEVETPVLSKFSVTDPYLKSIEAMLDNKKYYLQTSPEFHMKRYLAAYCEPIFQISRSFRSDESGSWHNPEFTLLEWYQLNIDHHQLLSEVSEFLTAILNTRPLIKITYQDAFLEFCGLDPFNTSLLEFKKYLQQNNLDNILSEDETDLDPYLFLIMTHIIEPKIKDYEYPLAIYAFPPSQCALAQVKNNRASRFEVYFKGIELANGFHELRDAQEQRERFNEDNLKRQHLGFKSMQPNEYFLEALEHGLPECSGVALGVDRLVAIALEKNSIKDVMSFDITNA